MVSTEFVLGILGAVGIAVFGYFYARRDGDIDRDFEKLWSQIDRLKDRANECDGRHDLSEERLARAVERISTLELRTKQ